ncbi:hypothetical protein RN001_012302 [Aquatica leii]|uniref:Uncharacterized protein n=1 Tax=Aquatica leii TaxID=1421715 RepID=A0AAN7SPF4_9COLE|nr:hypothetical protein RN001_012302 [Aquatica leii]
MTSKTWVFSLLFFIYVYANEEKESSIVLWYPIPIHLKQLEALTQSQNLSKCQEFILQQLVRPNFANKQISSCNNPKVTERILDTESKADPTDSLKLPTTVSDDVSVRHSDVEPQESLENINNGGEDKSIESRIITIPQSEVQAVTKPVTNILKNPSNIATRKSPDTIDRVAPKEILSPNKEMFNEEDLVYRGMIPVPAESFKQDDITTRIDAAPVNNDVTSGPQEDLGSLVKDYIDRGEGSNGKPCNYMHRFKNEELFKLWHQQNDINGKQTAICSYICTAIGENIYNKNNCNIQEVRKFCSNVATRWQNVSRSHNFFLTKYDHWLEVLNLLKELNIPIMTNLSPENEEDEEKKEEAFDFYYLDNLELETEID